MSQKQLSADALRVLRAIHERGLTVLWSFFVPHPTYDGGETMPDADWEIAERELWQTYTETVRIPTTQTRTLVRQSIRSGMHITEKVVVAPDGSEYAIAQTIETLHHPLPDQQLPSQESIEQHFEQARQRVWESDYIEREKIDRDDLIEEHEGLLMRYTLTPAAVAVISG